MVVCLDGRNLISDISVNPQRIDYGLYYGQARNACQRQYESVNEIIESMRVAILVNPDLARILTISLLDLPKPMDALDPAWPQTWARIQKYLQDLPTIILADAGRKQGLLWGTCSSRGAGKIPRITMEWTMCTMLEIWKHGGDERWKWAFSAFAHTFVHEVFGHGLQAFVFGERSPPRRTVYTLPGVEPKLAVHCLDASPAAHGEGGRLLEAAFFGFLVYGVWRKAHHAARSSTAFENIAQWVGLDLMTGKFHTLAYNDALDLTTAALMPSTSTMGTPRSLAHLPIYDPASTENAEFASPCRMSEIFDTGSTSGCEDAVKDPFVTPISLRSKSQSAPADLCQLASDLSITDNSSTDDYDLVLVTQYLPCHSVES